MKNLNKNSKNKEKCKNEYLHHIKQRRKFRYGIQVHTYIQ